MPSVAFLITIDTEGDNVWARQEAVTTKNARFIPRFQNLCERFGFKPTYLVNYEMAIDPLFQEFGRSALSRSTCEIGLHVHPWYSPPDQDQPQDWFKTHPYLYELSPNLLRSKLQYMTDLLTRTFDVQPRSHRAGRWGFDERVARCLVELGYSVDCSVSPGVCLKKHKGLTTGSGGPDYYDFPVKPYFLDLDDIRKSGTSTLLEIPVTILPNYSSTLSRFHHAVEAAEWIRTGRAIRKVFGPPVSWLRPNGRNLQQMYELVCRSMKLDLPVLEFMLHSSELMPGGSPLFKTEESIETLYDQMEALFSKIASLNFSGMTLSEYRDSLRV